MTTRDEASQAIQNIRAKATQATQATWFLACNSMALELHFLRESTKAETEGSYLEELYHNAVAMSHGEWITAEEMRKKEIDARINELSFFGGNGKRTKERIAKLEKARDEMNEAAKL